MRDLPTGTVTFLFTDIEGSTRLLGQLGERYGSVLETHQRLLRGAFAGGDGLEIMTEGDSFFCVFRGAPQAVAAAVEAQRALDGHQWPEGVAVRARMGLHTGQGTLGGDNYVGIDVHRAARIAAAGHGGQILLSAATRALTEQALPDGVSLRDLGEHRLKDLSHPEHLFQVVVEGLRADFPPVRSLAGRPGNIPSQLTSFVGRRQEIEEVKERLGGTRLLTLTGPGGTGKTRLSIQVGSELQDEFEDGAFFVALAPITDPEVVMTTIAQAMGLREEPNRPMIQTLSEYLEGKHVLLVLDNFEQVVDAAPRVGEMLTASERLTVLVTSREALRLHGEQEYPVPPLRLPDVEHLPPLEALSQYEAVALFIDRAAAVKPGFRVTSENAPAIAQICARLDGLPLAIELAAARAKLLTPEAMLKRLEHRLTLLAGGPRDLPRRQQTLRDAIDWSYDLLDEDERKFFSRLSVFVGGFTLEAVESVCNPDSDLPFDALEGVASLMNKSLLKQTEGEEESRFFMLETIREYATERLAEAPDGQEVARRHAVFFLALAEQAEPELLGADQASWLDTLEREHDNLRAAIRWSGERGQVEMALLLGGALWRFWQIRGHLREGAMRLSEVLSLPASGEFPAARAKALEAAGGVFYWMADWEKSERSYSECLELRKQLGDRPGIAEALYNMSFLFTVPTPPRRDLNRGRELGEEALEVYREVGDRRGEAKVLWSIANVHQAAAEWRPSFDASEEALELFREMDDRFGMAWALHSSGIAALGLGDLDRARAAMTESLELFSAAGDLTGIALVLNDFSVLEWAAGEDRRGMRLRGAALKVEQQSGQALVSNYDVLPWADEMIGRAASDPEYQKLLDEGDSMSVEEAISYALRRDDSP